MTNKTEKTYGNLVIRVSGWQLHSPYGVFPLAKALQSKPETEGLVEASVLHGEVVDYHFVEDKFDY